MPKRFMSLLLALLYFSVSLGVSSAHDHDHGDTAGKQCVACAWLANSLTDAPPAPEFIRPPTVLISFLPSVEVTAEAHPRLLRADRGPPSVS